MANHNSNGYYGGPYYPGPEEGPVGNTGNNEYQPPNHADLSTGLQAPHHGMHTEGSFQPASWFSNMYMGQIYSRPPSQESIYNGHGHYMSPYSPEEAPAPGLPSGLNMTSMMGPQPPHTPSPNGITNGHDHHHSPPTYYSPYVGLGTMAGAPEGVTGCPTEVDSTNPTLSSDSANMAMQALTLNPVRGPTEDNGIPHDDRSVDWTRRRFQPAEQQSGVADAAGGIVEGVEIKQEAADQPWRVGELVPRTTSRNSSSGNSPLREEHETRENNWKAAGKTRTKDKYRVVYSDHQRVELEREFHFGRYITIRRKSELASQLGLSERQVKIWFQNRRAKERKQTKKREDKMESHMSYHNGQSIHSISNHHHHHHHHQHLSHSLTGPPPAHIPLTPFMMDVKPNLGLD